MRQLGASILIISFGSLYLNILCVQAKFKSCLFPKYEITLKCKLTLQVFLGKLYIRTFLLVRQTRGEIKTLA